MQTKQAQDSVQQMLGQLRESFLADMAERLDRMDNLLMRIEKGEQVEEQFQALYREVHSMKGSGGIYGLHIISSICNQWEDYLNSIADFAASLSPEFIDSSLGYIDLLRETVTLARKGQEAFPETERKLRALFARTFAKPYSILIVDHSRLAVNIYTQALSKLPVRPVAMHDGYAALLRALTEPFDMLITALETPILNGTALIGAIRLSGSKNKEMKTILVTSNPIVQRHSNRATDADFMIVKDARIAQNLKDTVEAVIGQAGTSAATPG